MKKLIIFDCDGVLVDSESLANQALVDYLSELSIKMSFSDALARFKGRRMQDCMDQIEEVSGQKLPKDFESTLRSKMGLAYEKNLKAIPGVEEVIKSLTGPKCVASNAPVQKTKISLTLTGLHKYFGEDIFSAYTIQKWKPEPDLFLHACKNMGATPDNCVVVEDSVLGVQAAVSAKMKVIHYVGADEPLSGLANYTPLREMKDLLAVLA